MGHPHLLIQPDATKRDELAQWPLHRSISEGFTPLISVGLLADEGLHNSEVPKKLSIGSKMAR